MSQKPQAIYRSDYKSPLFTVDSIHLSIDLYDDCARVESIQKMSCLSSGADLVLNGSAQKLISVAIDDRVLTPNDYVLDDVSLTLHSLPDEFTLHIISENKPQDNTDLMGLYLSNHTFCTQCESEGFRKITYYLDRPDVLSIFTTRITADKQKYPVLLSNGNCVEQGNLDHGRHYAVWHDPFKKPCYLFAMVAGDLACIDDHFVTQSGRKVALKIFADQAVIDQCHFAMEAVKKSMKWDEEHYGREYDLDIFMIVAVNDFNFGAMENKGLNIFNDKYILANPETATDVDYGNVDRVVGHEYFHNWSGNRVTLRDWFQLSLKEGLTVFREQSFCESVASPAVERINHVRLLRSMQFPEDAGPLAHPVRPDAYIEINNFYTMTVYEKGSELIRMLHVILGPELYRKGTDLYFERSAGCAVTCDDFVQAMEDASGVDLTQFKLWYSQAGTPRLTVADSYDRDSKKYVLTVEQRCPDTPEQSNKLPQHIPLKMALLNRDGNVLRDAAVLHVTQEKQVFEFEGIAEKPVPSLLHHFSAPVILNHDYSDEQLSVLMAHDEDAFMRWEAGQTYALRVLQLLLKQHIEHKTLTVPEDYINALQVMLQSDIDDGLKAEMLHLPSLNYLVELLHPVNPKILLDVYRYLRLHISEQLEKELNTIYDALSKNVEYTYEPIAVAKRQLKNICLHYLGALKNDHAESLAYEQYERANNMTDRSAALTTLVYYGFSKKVQALNDFFQRFKHLPTVLDKWFSVQSLSEASDTLLVVQQLCMHDLFTLKNPNRVRSVLGALTQNFFVLHQEEDGRCYQFLAESILRIDPVNPGVASRLATGLTKWKQFEAPYGTAMRSALELIYRSEKLSPGLFEIVEKSLRG